MTLLSGQTVPGLTYWGFIVLVVVMVILVSIASRRATGRGDQNRQARNLVPPVVAGVQTLWIVLTGLLAFGGFFAHYQAVPPPFVFGVFPALLLCIVLVLARPSREFLLRIPPAWVVGLQVFRVFVELVLWSLSHHEVIPKSMTFEGRNFDVFTGLSAPLIAYLCFVRKGPRWLAWVWNAMGVLLLANVVGIALLAAPGPFYHSTNGMPNLVPSVFPFAWLPYYLVPLALLGHLISISQLTQPKEPTSRERTKGSPAS